MGSIESTVMEEDTNAQSAPPRRSHRRRRATEPTATQNSGDNPSWWEFEHQDLIMDQAMNTTSRQQPNADLNTLKTDDENFNRLAEAESARPSDEQTTNESDLSEVQETIYQPKEELGPEKSQPENTQQDNPESSTARSTEREQSLDEFKAELRVKRLARQSAVQDLRDELSTLRQKLADEQALTQRLRKPDKPDNAAVIDEEMLSVASMSNSSSFQDLRGAAACGTPIEDADDKDPKSRGRHAIIELANAQYALQLANAENISLRTELGAVQKQAVTLKEVIACCKQMLSMKEDQCTQLKTKLTDIESSLAEREMKIMSDNLRQEYERQLGNIRQLKQLYEERQRVAAAEQENLQRLISIKKDELVAEQEKTKNFEERIQTLVKEVETANNELATLREECNEHKFEKKALKEEMGAVNTLFSQMVMGFNGRNNLDIDRLTTMLEENRTLLNDMATKEANCSDGATLPKLLFELVEQASVGRTRSLTPTLTEPQDAEAQASCDEADEDVGDYGATATAAAACEQTKALEEAICHNADKDNSDTGAGNDTTITSVSTATTPKNAKKHHRKNAAKTTKIPVESSATTLKFHEPEDIGKVASAQEIIGNLPKVWKVLMELLSHHKIEQVQFEENGAGDLDCYKSVETPNGPRAELSVSKTYIKLKDLILEKKSLVKETNRLKTLNSHLDYRLNAQEKRLSTVSLELTKTWHLVGKMQRQHRQLHTQEQILRYQLQQKRRLLSELKEELEYCRRKWAAARAKNDESQEQWNDLRQEFAKRKLEDANNSAESGYSDSGQPSDEEERVVVEAAGATSSRAAHPVGGRRKLLKDMFEHTRKIKRMQSTSPSRAGVNAGGDIVLRWNSAPPTCGWRGEDDDDEEDDGALNSYASTNKGAIPKVNTMHSSRSTQRRSNAMEAAGNQADENENATEGGIRSERTARIHKLEEQCKSLIQQVLETSDNREKLEVQLCRFTEEIAPVQYAVPLDEFINKKRFERMTRASSVPLSGSGTLTPREEEYTRKRSERLERLEEESRQLMSRIKRTSDRGHYLRCSLDRIRRAPSREDSLESNTEEELGKVNENEEANERNTSHAQEENSILTLNEEQYTARRAARLERLEAESRSLLTRLTNNATRGGELSHRLEALHERCVSEEGPCGNCVRKNSIDEHTDQAKNADVKEMTPEREVPSTIEQRLENIEKVAQNRQERLRILEEEGKELLSKLSSTSARGTRMIDNIAARELKRQSRLSSTPSREENATKDDSKDQAGAAAVWLPTPKTVACASIVDEELTDSVIVTTTPSQIALEQGAIPKSKPSLLLSAAARASIAPRVQRISESNAESLADMLKRLEELPYPDDHQDEDEGEEQETEVAAKDDKEVSNDQPEQHMRE